MRFSVIHSTKIYEFVDELKVLGFSTNKILDIVGCESPQEVIDYFSSKFAEYYFTELSNILGDVKYIHKDIFVYKAVFFVETIIRRVIVFEISNTQLNKLKLKNLNLYESLIKYKILDYKNSYESIHTN